MPIFDDSYQTTVGSMFVTKQIETAIKEAIIKDGLDSVNLNVKHDGKLTPVFITGRLNSESEIPLFTHPISIFNFQHKDYLCTDLRFYVRKDTPLDELESGVKNRTEFNFAKSRAILNLAWMSGGVNQIKNGLSFAGTVFAAWLSEVIAKTYALDFKDQMTLSVITSFYYQTLFNEESIFNEESKQKMAVHTIKATRAPSEQVFQIFDRIGAIENINDYCRYVVEILENVRLKNFNLAVLLTIVKNSWYGTNAKEVISVALEHPPTWNAVVYAALNEKTFRSSMIYRVAERFGKRGAADEFNHNYISLVKEHTGVAMEEAPIVFKDFD